MSGIAALQMYDLPALRQATDALWTGIAAALRARGQAAPESLTRGVDPYDVWRDPALLFAQTCGYPYWNRLRDHVRLVATPVYSAPGCEGPRYRSAIVVRADDTARGLSDCKGYRPAVNARDSQSGHNALRAAVAPLARGAPLLGCGIETGAHLASADAVAGGAADIAAIDCVTWALAGRAAPDAVAGLRRIAWSLAAPALPFVTAAMRDDAGVAILRDALKAALAEENLAEARAALMLEDVVFLREDAYATIPAMEAAAGAAGQPPLL
ncbi:MAG: PhnD/SsuA/transferrin family substrate-binding protein [Pseudomonadota bacterium]